jgi:hypothetical protein
MYSVPSSAIDGFETLSILAIISSVNVGLRAY